MKKKYLMIAVLVCLLTVSMLLTACGGADTSGTTAADQKDGPTIVVSSKTFTENILLGRMTYDYLKDLGYPVEEKLNLGATDFLRTALGSGEVGMYWEYDGTVLMIVMEHEAIYDPDLCYQTVKEWDVQNDIIWLDKADLNDTNAFLVRKDTAEEYNLTKFSEMVELIKSGTRFKVAASEEFLQREDSMPRIESVYDFNYPREDCIQVGMGLSMEAIKNGETDLEIGFSTEPRIEKYDLVILEDDKNCYPSYYAAPNFSKEILDAYPTLADDMKKLSSAVNTENIVPLIGQVDLDHMSEAEVSQNFLKEKGLIK